jgi:hypothetical protein
LPPRLLRIGRDDFFGHLRRLKQAEVTPTHLIGARPDQQRRA